MARIPVSVIVQPSALSFVREGWPREIAIKDPSLIDSINLHESSSSLKQPVASGASDVMPLQHPILSRRRFGQPLARATSDAHLAWHSHRPKRLQVFTNQTLACGFRDDRLARR